MGSDNVETVRSIYEAFGRGDVGAFLNALTEDIEWDESPGMPYGGVYHGRDEIVSKVIQPITTDVDGFTAEPDEVVSLDGERVFAQGQYGGQGARGPVDARFVHLWTVRDGKVTRYQQLADTKRFCDAVGR